MAHEKLTSDGERLVIPFSSDGYGACAPGSFSELPTYPDPIEVEPEKSDRPDCLRVRLCSTHAEGEMANDAINFGQRHLHVHDNPLYLLRRHCKS